MPSLDPSLLPARYPLPSSTKASKFARLIDKLGREGGHGCILGDSRSTPTGAGRNWSPVFNATFAALFGNSPGTTVMSPGSVGAGIGSYWLCRPTAQAPDAVFHTQAAAIGITAAHVPPGMEYRASDVTRSVDCFNFSIDYNRANRNMPYARGRFAKQTGSYYIDVWLVAHNAMNADDFGGDAQLSWEVFSHNSSTTDYVTSGTSRGSGTTSVDFSGMTLGQLTKVTLGPFTLSGSDRYLSFTSKGTKQPIGGSVGQGYTVMAAVRFRNATNPEGAVVTLHGTSGLRVSSWLAFSSVVWEALGLIYHDADFIGVRLGTNDAGNSVSASTYQTNVRSLITNIRTHFGPEKKIILFADYPRWNLTAPQAAQYLLYPHALYEIAESDDYCLFINGYNMAHMIGFTEENSSLTGITDGGDWAAVSEGGSVTSGNSYHVSSSAQAGLAAANRERKMHFRVTTTHTKAAADQTTLPGDQLNGSSDNSGATRFLRSGFFEEDYRTDKVHTNIEGSMMIAHHEIMCLLNNGAFGHGASAPDPIE